MYAFEQALQSLEQHAEFWLDAALYLERYAHTLMSNGVCYAYLQLQHCQCTRLCSYLVY